MGYTHYWERPRNFTPAEFSEVCAAASKILETTSCPVFGHNGKGPPEITSGRVALNGDATRDLEHETFEITRSKPDYEFCKTARKPYNVVVTALLTYLSNAWDFRVDSDGDPSDWDAGVALAEQALGRRFYNPMVLESLRGAA